MVSPDDWEEAREERSAIMEHDGGLSREEADAQARESTLRVSAQVLAEVYRTQGRDVVERLLRGFGQAQGNGPERELRDKLNEVLRNG